MRHLNENEISLQLTDSEGLHKRLTIADIKEVQRLLLNRLSAEVARGNLAGVADLLERHAPPRTLHLVNETEPN